ncbi:hypothetical protein [Synechocystis sp. PCC 7509]|uniref:hypothetical protein n=1 Tax=Synechocystis sp. PCC 7509 TaxID=927677 RepID=UPI0002AC7872|nr:hypothetical protein [Synechocystis sp. PCC 7509]
MNRQRNSHFKLLTIACLAGLIVLGTQLNNTSSFAQSAKPQELWQQVYQRLPNLPLENKYVSKETGKVDENSTLVTRLLQYHLYVKGRAPGYRLDWKLTLADYLGANELIDEAAYPGNDTFNTNPLESDRTAISKLNRQDRHQLVQTLVSLFNQNTRSPANNTSPNTNSSTNPVNQSNSPPPPRPGDADSLKL